MRIRMLTVAGFMMLAGCVQGPVASTAPVAVTKPAPESEDARIAALLARMSLERKVAQLIQPQINSFTAADNLPARRRRRLGALACAFTQCSPRREADCTAG